MASKQAAASRAVTEGNRAFGKPKAREERPLTCAHYIEHPTHGALSMVALRRQDQPLMDVKKMALHIRERAGLKLLLK